MFGIEKIIGNPLIKIESLLRPKGAISGGEYLVKKNLTPEEAEIEAPSAEDVARRLSGFNHALLQEPFSEEACRRAIQVYGLDMSQEEGLEKDK